MGQKLRYATTLLDRNSLRQEFSWSKSCLGAGALLGNIPFVQDPFLNKDHRGARVIMEEEPLWGRSSATQQLFWT